MPDPVSYCRWLDSNENRGYCSTERLRWNGDGSCILLDQGKCSIHPARPTQCATYPFWSSHLASEVDWRATAATCEGITPQKMQKVPERSTREPSDASSKRTALQLIDEFRTSPQAGHGVEPPGKITPAQVRCVSFITIVVEHATMITSRCHASTDG